MKRQHSMVTYDIFPNDDINKTPDLSKLEKSLEEAGFICSESLTLLQRGSSGSSLIVPEEGRIYAEGGIFKMDVVQANKKLLRFADAYEPVLLQR